MNRTARHLARKYAVQALYSWKLSRNNIKDIESQFLTECNMINVDIAYFHELCIGTVTYTDKLDELMMPYLSCNLNTLGYIEHTVLRIALFEMSKCKNIPYKVVINEAIELMKIFGNEKSYKFINGVLDKVAIKIRPNRK